MISIMATRRTGFGEDVRVEHHDVVVGLGDGELLGRPDTIESLLAHHVLLVHRKEQLKAGWTPSVELRFTHDTHTRTLTHTHTAHTAHTAHVSVRRDS